MKTQLILSVVCLLGFSYRPVFAQLPIKPLALNAVYIEALGMGGYGSVNYERLLFYQKKMHLGLRLGIGTYRLRDFEMNFNPDLTVPFSIHAYYGKTHHIEIGAGQTFTSIVRASALDFAVERKSSLSSNFLLGYRYQKSSGGLLFRLNYSPIVSSNEAFKHWYGLSVGYAF